MCAFILQRRKNKVRVTAKRWPFPLPSRYWYPIVRSKIVTHILAIYTERKLGITTWIISSPLYVLRVVTVLSPVSRIYIEWRCSRELGMWLPTTRSISRKYDTLREALVGKYTCGGAESSWTTLRRSLRRIDHDAHLSRVPKLNNDVKKLISEWRNALCYQVSDLA